MSPEQLQCHSQQAKLRMVKYREQQRQEKGVMTRSKVATSPDVCTK